MNQYLTMFRYIFAYFTINSLRIVDESTNKVDNRTILVQLFDQYVYLRMGNIVFEEGRL